MSDDSTTSEILTTPLVSTACRSCGETIEIAGLAAFSDITCPHCKHDQVAPVRFGNFLLVGKLGAGGMGGVYEGYDEALKRSVAIKVLRKELGDDAEFVAGFQKEAQAAATLNHPNVIQIHSFGQEQGQPYIVMELVSGRHLASLIEERGPQDIHETLRIGFGIARGLEAAAASGLMHGDVKPENILMDDSGTPKLADFGLAGSIGRSEDTAVWGTPNYISPEKINRAPQTERSDMYSLGATLYHAIAGRPPFEGETTNELIRARLEREPVPLSKAREDVPEAVSNVITRMLRMDPGARHPTYASLTADIAKTMDAVMDEMRRSGKIPRPRGAIKIRKKTPGGAAKDGAAQESPAPDAAGRKGSKIVVTRGKGTMRPPAPDQSKAAEIKQKAEEQKVQSRARRKKRSRVVLLVFFALILIGGATVAIMHYSSLKRDRYDRYRLKRGLDTLVGDRINAVEAARRAWAEPAGIVGDASEQWQAAKTAAVTLLGQSVIDDLPKPDPAARVHEILNPPKEEEKDKDAQKTEEDEDQQENAAGSSDEDKPDAAPEPAEVKAADTGESPEPEANGDSEPIQPEPIQPEPEQATPAAPFPSVSELANVDMTTRNYTNAVAAYQDAVVEATLATHATNELGRMLAANVKSNDLAQAAAVTDLVNAIKDGIEARDVEIESQIALIKAHLERAGGALKKLGQAGKTLQQELARAEKIVTKRKAAWEAEEAERERRDAEALASTERAEATVREKEAVASLRAENKHHVLSHDYREAARALKPRKNEFVTDEGSADYQSLIESFALLAELRNFLTDNLKEKRCPWCWRTQVDITGADKKGLRLADEKRLVPWNQVTPRDYLALIRHYLSRGNSAANRQTRGRMALASAVYCYQLDARNAARGFRDQALEIWTSDKFREQLERLLPGIDAEE